MSLRDSTLGKGGTLKVSNIPREAYPVEVEEAIADAYHTSIPVRPQRQDYVRHVSLIYLRILHDIGTGYQSL